MLIVPFVIVDAKKKRYDMKYKRIDVNGITQSMDYMDSTEVYNALADYIADYLGSDEDFCKRVFRYMLMEGSLSGAQVCLLLFDQGVLDMKTEKNFYSPF